MIEHIRAKAIVILVSVSVLGGTAAVVAVAAPGHGPAGPSGQEATVTETVEPTETLEPAETVEPTETLEPTETQEPVATATPTGDHGDANDEDDGEVDNHDDGQLGVPLDSPACAGDLTNPNPHDTDSDGDGCREVTLPDGSTKNLPDPAADAQEGNPGHIGELHGNGHGRPTGTPPFGHGHNGD